MNIAFARTNRVSHELGEVDFEASAMLGLPDIEGAIAPASATANVIPDLAIFQYRRPLKLLIPGKAPFPSKRTP